MARQTIKKCDICGRECNQIVGKINFTPLIPGASTANHNNYSHHADVGNCCRDRLLSGFRWRKRLTAQEYQQARRA
jgi:hypothetical protein